MNYRIKIKHLDAVARALSLVTPERITARAYMSRRGDVRIELVPIDSWGRAYTIESVSWTDIPQITSRGSRTLGDSDMSIRWAQQAHVALGALAQLLIEMDND